ncbi:MAG: hypothetical protein ACYC5J_08035 [Chloroflexota bacterium]
MSTKQTVAFLISTFAQAVGLTVVTSTMAAHLATEPFGQGVWWHWALWLAVPALWMFLFWLLVIGGVIWLIAFLQHRGHTTRV